MANEKANQKTDSAYAYECLRADIISGRIRHDERIVESYYAQKLGISRTPVREALRLLERDGLVDFQPNCGATARGIFTPEEAEEVFHMRALLQLDAAEATVKNITKRELSAMAGCNAACALAIDEEELASYVKHSGRFERFLAQASKRPVCEKLLLFLNNRYPLAGPGGMEAGVHEEPDWSYCRKLLRCHVHIWEALEEHDLQSYTAALTELQTRERDHVMNFFEGRELP